MAKSGLLGGAGQVSPVFSNPGSVFQRGQGGILPERGSQAQYDMVNALLQSGIASSQNSGSPLLAFLAPMIGGAVGSRTEGLYRDAQEGRDSEAIDKLLAAMGGGKTPQSAVYPQASAQTSTSETSRNEAMAAYGGPTKAAAAAMDGGNGSIASGIVETARALGMDPVDLGTIISYETAGTFDPTKAGPTTQWGQHRGLIQFGEPQAREYGVNWNDPVASQLGADGAVAKYFIKNGWQPGMGMMDAYSIVNAGAPGRYNASDANNGGAPGTVADKVNNQMSGHRQNAMRLLGGDFSTYANVGKSAPMDESNMRTLIGLMTSSDVSEPIRDLAGSMLTQAIGASGGLSPREQIGLAKDMIGLEAALSSAKTDGRFRVATPEEAAAYGATAGQIGPDGRFYPAPARNSSGDAAVLRQQNEATSIISDAVEGLQTQGYSREEALSIVSKDPIYAQQFAILGVDPATLSQSDDASSESNSSVKESFWQRFFGGSSSENQDDNDPLGIR